MTTTLALSGISSGSNLNPKRLNLLLYGPFGSRKTVSAHAMPRTRTLDFDDGLQSVEWAVLAGKLEKKLEDIVYETILGDRKTEKGIIEMINFAMDVVDEWVEEEDIPEEDWNRPYEQHWDTLIIDSASFLTDGAVELALKENDRLDLSKSFKEGRRGLKKEKVERGLFVYPMRIQDWGSARQLFQKAVKQWKTLGKNLVLVCHEYVETDSEGRIQNYLPALIGQDRGKIPAMFDEVWLTQLKPKGKELDVVFRTQADTKRPLKTRLGCLEPEEEADFQKIRSKVAKFYGVDEEKIWTAYHGTEGRERAEKESAKEVEII